MLLLTKRKDITRVTGTAALAFEKGLPTGTIILTHIGNDVYAEADTATRFLAMKAAAAADGVTLVANSGFRSMTSQTALYAAYVARGMAAPIVARPGFSNHQSGKALDIQIPPAGTAPDDPKRLASKEYKWLRANASKYGFFNDIAAHRESWHWSHTGR